MVRFQLQLHKRCGVDWRRCQLGLISPMTRVRLPLPLQNACLTAADCKSALRKQIVVVDFRSREVRVLRQAQQAGLSLYIGNSSCVGTHRHQKSTVYGWFDSTDGTIHDSLVFFERQTFLLRKFTSRVFKEWLHNGPVAQLVERWTEDPG